MKSAVKSFGLGLIIAAFYLSACSPIYGQDSLKECEAIDQNITSEKPEIERLKRDLP